VPVVGQACVGPNTGVPGTCTVLGRCSESDLDCANLGQPCPSLIPGDTCLDSGFCIGGVPPPREFACNELRYVKPVVPITALPIGQPPMVRALANWYPDDSGLIPIGPAVQGGIKALRERQLAHPDRKMALLLVSDGIPGGCRDESTISPPFVPDPKNLMPGIARTLAEANAGPAPIATHVIGILSDAEMATAAPELDKLALAGGTGKALVLGAGVELAQRFQETFDRIRSPLPCAYKIPAPASGALDPGRVSVAFTTGAGMKVEVPGVERADRCHPVEGGWYYDVEPATGTPTQIITCDATCTRLQAEKMGQVDLVVGCRKPIE
jgi:hypothetical protein